MSVHSALLDLLNTLGVDREEVRFQRKGKIVYIKCLFHTERTPSLRIMPDHTYCCFGCNQIGDFRDKEHLQEVLDLLVGQGPSPESQDEIIDDTPWDS